MYFQNGHQLPDKQVSDGRAKKTFVCHCLSHLLISPHFLSRTHDRYVKAMSEISKIIFNRLYNFLLHYDIIFKFTPVGRRLLELSNILHQYTGISWVWVAWVHNNLCLCRRIGLNVKWGRILVLNGAFICTLRKWNTGPSEEFATSIVVVLWEVFYMLQFLLCTIFVNRHITQGGI